MKISRFGVTLSLLEETSLETVRMWRNQDNVRLTMEFVNQISPKEQHRWFLNLDKTCNLYFIFSESSKNIGLINLKEIDWNNETAEAGIFTGNHNYLNTSYAMKAIMVLMDWAFFCLKLKNVKAKIGISNQKTQSFNQRIGYQFFSETSNSHFHYYVLKKENYLNQTKKFRNMLLDSTEKTIVTIDKNTPEFLKNKISLLTNDDRTFLGLFE